MALSISDAMLACDLAGSEAAADREESASRASPLEADNKENVPRFQSALASIHLRSDRAGPVVHVYDAADETPRIASARSSTAHAPQQPGTAFTVHIDKPKRGGKPKARAAAKELARHGIDKENAVANVAEPLAAMHKLPAAQADLHLGHRRAVASA